MTATYALKLRRLRPRPAPVACVSAWAEDRLAQTRFRRACCALVIAGVLLQPAGAVQATDGPAPAAPSAIRSDAAFEQFLDWLMIAESGGRRDARNPRSTAVGPFQFIESTFLAVARRAAVAFTQDNADHLAAIGLPSTFTNLRLAHLLGPAGTARILRAPAGSQVALWLGPAAISANPFMAGMRVEDLIARCEREANTDGGLVGRQAVGADSRAAKPPIAVACDLGLASCRRWLALAERRLARGGRGR